MRGRQEMERSFGFWLEAGDGKQRASEGDCRLLVIWRGLRKGEEERNGEQLKGQQGG